MGKARRQTVVCQAPVLSRTTNLTWGNVHLYEKARRSFQLSFFAMEYSDVHDVELTAVSRTEWTIRDSRVNRDDAESLLGFTECFGGRYETLEFGDPVRFFYFSTMAEVVVHFHSLRPQKEIQRQTRLRIALP